MTFNAIGDLPPGLTLNPTTGNISGSITPGATGEYTVTIVATDGDRIGETVLRFTVVDCPESSSSSSVVSSSVVSSSSSVVSSSSSSGMPSFEEFRPLTAIEFEDNPPVNPARSRIINGTNAIDNDAAIGSSTTYAESQMDSCTSVILGLAALDIYDFPEPSFPGSLTSVEIHVLTEYLCATHFGSPDGPFFAGTQLLNAHNPNPVGAHGTDNVIANIDGHTGNIPASLAEYSYTISLANWASQFGSSAANVFVRMTQYDSQNFTFEAPSKMRLYDIWIRYNYA